MSEKREYEQKRKKLKKRRSKETLTCPGVVTPWCVSICISLYPLASGTNWKCRRAICRLTKNIGDRTRKWSNYTSMRCWSCKTTEAKGGNSERKRKRGSKMDGCWYSCTNLVMYTRYYGRSWLRHAQPSNQETLSSILYIYTRRPYIYSWGLFIHPICFFICIHIYGIGFTILLWTSAGMALWHCVEQRWYRNISYQNVSKKFMIEYFDDVLQYFGSI